MPDALAAFVVASGVATPRFPRSGWSIASAEACGGAVPNRTEPNHCLRCADGRLMQRPSRALACTQSCRCRVPPDCGEDRGDPLRLIPLGEPLP